MEPSESTSKNEVPDALLHTGKSDIVTEDVIVFLAEWIQSVKSQADDSGQSTSGKKSVNT
jgi:hypothetical protein